MFWRFGGYANISNLDSTLDKPDVTLDEILEDQDLIQELKSNNTKLIEFLREEPRLKQLLQYVIAPKPPEAIEEEQRPSSPAEKRSSSGSASGSFFRKGRSSSRDAGSPVEERERKRMKLAYTACEVLSSEVWSIYEALFETQELLQIFWEYVKRDAPLDSLQAGYFTKVNESLLEKKPEQMVAFIESVEEVVPNLMRHIDCPMMMDLLLKLISLEKEPSCQGVVGWLQSQDLIQILLSYISPEHPSSTQTSAGDFLKAIITISANATGQDTTVIGPNELTRELVSEKIMKLLVDKMLAGGNPLTVGVGIIIEVIRKNNSDYDSEAQIGPEPKSSDPIYLGTLLRIFSGRISDFMELILSAMHTSMRGKGVGKIERQAVKVAWNDEIEPLGFDRFKTCELMAELLHCSNMGLLNERGSDAAVKLRDQERERLKQAGKLLSGQEQAGGDEYGTSVDSSGFHHAEKFSSSSGSPDNMKRLEVQNSNEDDEFEKVAMSEAVPDLGLVGSPDGTDKTVSQSPVFDDDTEFVEEPLSTQAQDTPTKGPESTSPQTSAISEDVDKLDIDKDTTMTDAPDSPSLQALSAEFADEAPAPLFSGRTAVSHPTDVGESETSQSHANETPQSSSLNEQTQDLPIIEKEDDGSPLVGDLLKMNFVEHKVVPTILDFFFRFPWNNFLHNVVYDVVQQVFNGSMERGYNRYVAIDLFEGARITEQIVEGQRRNDKSEQERRMRLGYMGHLTLIAEEVIKFTERQNPEQLSQLVVDKLTNEDFREYITQTLPATRERDNAILGGHRPDTGGSARSSLLGGQSAFGNTGSAALANAGLGGGGGGGLDSMDLANAGNSGYGGASSSLLSGFGSSDDEEDEDMEEGEIGDESQRALADDNQSSNEQFLDNSSSSVPPIPAPLAIPPSRARRQLAARLAEKQRLATAPSSGSTSTSQEHTLASSAVATGLASATSTATAPASGVVHIPRRFPKKPDEDIDDDEATIESDLRDRMRRGKDDREGSSSEGSDIDDENISLDDVEDVEDDSDDAFSKRSKAVPGLDEEDEDEGPWKIRRQTTQEALKREPLDVDDDDENENKDAKEETTEEESLGSPESSGTDNTDDEGNTGQRTGDQDKKREQQKLLRQWGFKKDSASSSKSSASAAAGTSQTQSTGGAAEVPKAPPGGHSRGPSFGATRVPLPPDDDSDDSDEEAVEIGSKYMSQRRGSRDVSSGM